MDDRIGDFERVLRKLSKSTRNGVSETYRLYLEGLISKEGLIGALRELLEVSATQAAGYGQVAYAQTAEIQLGAIPETVARATVTAQHNHRAIIAKSLESVLSGDAEGLDERLLKLGENLPTQAAQRAYTDSLRSDNRVTGWTRGLDSAACELCQWLAQDGKVFPHDANMATHNGCVCQQIPVN